MMPKRLAIAASTFCLALAASACGPQRAVVPLRPDVSNPERFQCDPAGARPTIPTEDVVDLDRALAAPTVTEAVAIVREELGAYVRSVRAREAVVARYIVQLEGQLFSCSDNMTWLRDFFRRLPAAPPATH